MTTQMKSQKSTPVPSLDNLRTGPATLSVNDAAKYLGVSRAYAYAMAREGRLPVIKLGKQRVRVPAEGLAKLLTGGGF